MAEDATVYEVISMAEYVYNGTQYVGIGERVLFSPDYRSRSNVEHVEKWREWCDKIPALQFDSDWNVKIIPPFGGAMARFTAKKADKHVSVYLDVFSELGAMYDEAGNPIPYYEVYDGENTPRFYLNETDEMMNYIREVLNGSITHG